MIERIKRNHFIYGRPKKLAFKIPFAYFLVILFTVGFSYLVLNHISTNSAQKKLNEASLQTITSIRTNVDLMIGNVNNYSKMIFSDPNLQKLLRQGDVYSNLQTQSKVSAYLYNLMQAVPIIDSVYIYDNSGHRFSVGTQELPTFMEAKIEDAPWYEQVVRNRGRYILALNQGQSFSEETSGNKGDGNIVSFIRLIRDIDNTSPLGVLVMNIKDEAFVQAYSSLLDQNSLDITILDENNRTIVADSADEPKGAVYQEILTANKAKLEQLFQQSDSGFLSANIGSQKYTVTYLAGGESNWKFVSISPHSTFQERNKSLVLLALVLLIVNGAIFFVSSFVISRSIIKPIQKLLRSMNKAPSGNFMKVNTEQNSYEFEQLYNGYNHMIEQIDQLLKRMIEEQKTIRKAELNTLQSQIKPHFLYNTLDSINSLALSGLNDQVCYLIEALGSYYRMSVSKGKDVITVGEEIEMVRNYLKIQKVRYHDVFEAQFEVDEACCQSPIPKLVLQPLAENSLYHGIRPKGTKGIIRISARSVDGTVSITISDDGVGMSREEIEQILQTERKGEIKSFGLWGTMERLRIFYGDKDCITVDSEPGKGTTITLIIPNGADALWDS
ncbi:sensor histidine kinase [Paenibacillus sp. alder61]|uniref:histidine kinase n=1 Tax=Paenibacillus faecis TaxID=862114 RepID=A0A5D0D1Q1_9BACL|nr:MULTISPECIES: sensor histidine kinase [Paenibacillus]MCA1291446.1 sensor histidine kinase [Paenibacillus sp. alder61]TYA14615.1 sensor histidine kinase [Paenibacillus faecis]